MMKKIISLLFVAAAFVCAKQYDDRKISRCTLNNGIEINLFEDFNMPVVLIGIILDAGNFDLSTKDRCISHIISENLINTKSYMKLKEIGASISVNDTGEYTEILAKVSPNEIKKFFLIILELLKDISIENIETIKKQTVIQNELSQICYDNVLRNEILSLVKMKDARANLVNDDADLQNITAGDVALAFSQLYNNCHISIIAAGAVSYKNFIKSLQQTFSLLPKRNKKRYNTLVKKNIKEIYVANKFANNSLRYFYNIPRDYINQNTSVFLLLLNRELFKFFQKMTPLASYKCKHWLIKGDHLFEICFYPKLDTSFEKIKQMYAIFLKHMCTKELISSLDFVSKYCLFDFTSDLQEIYELIKYSDISGRKLILSTNNKIKNTDVKAIQHFAEQLFYECCAINVTTQYKADK